MISDEFNINTLCEALCVSKGTYYNRKLRGKQGYTEAMRKRDKIKPIIKEIYDEIEYRNEYYFGESLFISPITKPKDLVMNRTIHKIFLPDGIWYDFKNGNKYNGNRRYVLFYKDEDYPVFVRQGSIIPLAVLNEDNLNSSNKCLLFKEFIKLALN